MAVLITLSIVTHLNLTTTLLLIWYVIKLRHREA